MVKSGEFKAETGELQTCPECLDDAAAQAEENKRVAAEQAARVEKKRKLDASMEYIPDNVASLERDCGRIDELEFEDSELNEFTAQWSSRVRELICKAEAKEAKKIKYMVGKSQPGLFDKFPNIESQLP
jgi:hypothetical protein